MLWDRLGVSALLSFPQFLFDLVRTQETLVEVPASLLEPKENGG